MKVNQLTSIEQLMWSNTVLSTGNHGNETDWANSSMTMELGTIASRCRLCEIPGLEF
jgi:hypothetical protein